MTETTEFDKNLDSVPDEEQIVVPMDVNGRDVLFRSLSSVQYMQLQHEGFLLEKDTTDMNRKRKSLDRVFRTMRSAIVNDDDKEYIEDLIADGKISLRELVRKILQVYKSTKDEPTPAVRRARTPRRR